MTLSGMLHAEPPCPPSERLLHVVALGLEQEVHIRNADSKAKPFVGDKVWIL
jgi:hypothetical protein